MAEQKPTLSAAPDPDPPGEQPAAKKTGAKKATPRKRPVKKPQRRMPRKGTARIPPPTAQELAEQRQRETQAIEMALAGVSYELIAQQLGFSDRSGAWRAVRRGLERQEAPKVAELREMENARLDRLQAAWWTKAITDKDPHAATVVLRIFERRAKLNGLDQQAARDAGALAEALLGDPEARRRRLTEMRDELAELRARKDAEAAAEETG